MKYKRALKPILIIGLLVAVAFSGWSGLKQMRAHLEVADPKKARVAGNPIPVSSVTIETRTLDTVVGAECVTKESKRVTLASEVGGTVSHLSVAVGDFVKQDQLLVELDDSTLLAVLSNAEQAQSAIKLTLSEMESYLIDVRELKEKGFVSSIDVLRAVDDVGKARRELISINRELIQSRHKINNTKIYAPFDGMVSSINVEQGATPKAFSELIVLNRVDPLQLECDFAENQLLAVEEHDNIEVSFQAYPERMFPATFYSIVPYVKKQTHILSVVLNVPNPERQLMPGMHAIARLGKSIDGLWVPSISLINSEGDKATVFVVNDEGVAQLRRVGIGRYANGYVRVLSELKNGERIVVSGQMYLQDGDVVTEGGGEKDTKDMLFPSRTQ